MVLLMLACVLPPVACAPPAASSPATSSRPAISKVVDLKAGGPLIPAGGHHRGVSWVAGRTPVTEGDLRPLVDLHVSWIAQNPFGWQERHDSPRVVVATEGHVLWGESDAGLEATALLARRSGIKTLLKPHLWLTDNEDGEWLGSIAMKDEQDWQRWFADYRAFMLHYARLAERTGMEALCVGAELRGTVVRREADWRKLIAEVRSVYRGKLTYAANWYQEFEEVPFWDALDFIGIQAYFPLSEKNAPSLDELKAGWRPHLEAIERVQKRTGKPVLFTEIGYRSTPDAAIHPWEWPDRSPRPGNDDGLALQASCYEAFFETLWRKEWFAGAYMWKWYPGGGGGRMRGSGGDFTPQGKPAETVLARWYAAGD